MIRDNAVLISPSILSADFMNLQHDVQLVSDGGADLIHFDVMDGHFVPNLTIGVPFVRAMKAVVDTPLDVHLMISNPAEQIDWYLDAGADIATIHIEACDGADEAVRICRHIRERGARAGISLNPETPTCYIEPLLTEVDMILVMSVHPGFGGQSFIESSPDKVAEIRGMCDRAGVSPTIEVDGGINPKTAPLVVRAGASALVAGNAVFGADDPVAAMQLIRESAEAALRR